jgi:TolB-like protein/tetratricopeptide (TPR) repeat protein
MKPSLYAELKRRNVIRAGLLYIGVVWALSQGLAQVLPVFDVPNQVVRWLIVAGMAGFPFWLAFAWFFELTPEGLKLERDVAPDASITPQTGRKLDFLIIGVLGVAVVLLLTERLVHRNSAPAAAPDKSIAVLPFVDMSQAKDQEYFSDGIAEDLLNLLVKVQNLQVAARTSSFSFKGKNLPIPEIAQALHVANVLEGSVRKSGGQVRISAQLVRAADGYEIWSQTWDRKLDDVFAIQDEIAAAVVSQLKVKLLGEVPTARPVDARAYPLILQAQALIDQGSPAADTQAIAVLQQALAIAPDESRAWAGLGRVYLNQSLFGERPAAEGSRLAKEASRRALALDPSDARASANLGRTLADLDNQPAAAAPYFQRALELAPGDLYVVNSTSAFLITLGRLDEARRAYEYRAARDPANPIAFGNLGLSLYFTGHWDQAIADCRTALALSPGYTQAHFYIGTALLLGKNDAAGALAEFQAETDELTRMQGMPLALYALHRKAEADAALADLIGRHGQDAPFYVATVYAWRGDIDSAFEWLDKAAAARDPQLYTAASEPLLGKLHQDPRWPLLLHKLGKAPEQLAQIEFKMTLPQDGSGATAAR